MPEHVEQQQSPQDSQVEQNDQGLATRATSETMPGGDQSDQEKARREADELYRIRHSCAHVMAQAVVEIFPEAQLAIGPPIEDGFYYDFKLPRALTPEDLEAIEDRMKRIIKGNFPFERWTTGREEAIQYFQERDQPFKVEILQDLPEEGMEDGQVSFYRQDQFTDLCRGPHVLRTGQIRTYKLLSVAGAYWRGDEHRPMLQRIYGTAWKKKEDLEAYLERLEEAKRRDHRKLGKELDLFSISEAVGPGLILWHPRGAMVRVIAEDFSRQAHLENGYEWVFSPHIGRANLWETSGHLGFYKENMYSPMDIEGEEYYAKPMNCPFHIQIYKSHLRSYRDLPRRYAEYGTVYRYERSGVLHGLTRVRGFTQDDAHIFCRPDQVEEEIQKALAFSLYILRSFGLSDFTAYLSTRPDKYVGDPADWDKATAALQRAVEAEGVPYEIDEGGGAFYGPKIDLKVNDALGREWQLSTIQFDFNMSTRFGLEYIGSDGQPHRPYMVHRALLGSMERFFGVLIEHFAGAFPVWLAPVQAVVLPIADRHSPYGAEVKQALKEKGLRAELDDRSENLKHRIREAQLQKAPYMLVLGDQEVTNRTVSIRLRTGENLPAMPLEDAVQFIAARNASRSLDLKS